MDKIKKDMLKEIAGIEGELKGAHSFRLDGKSYSVKSTDTISVIPRKEKDGIEVHVAPGTENEVVHIPVLISQSGITEIVKNDFYIGENSSVYIIAGCGIHNEGDDLSQHDGIHSFYIGENSKVWYVEKHSASGDGKGNKVLNPVTNIYMEKGSRMEIDTLQMNGVDFTERITHAELKDDTTLLIKEKLLTTDSEYAKTVFEIELDGENSSTDVVSRSVAKGNSEQVFLSKINGNNNCKGHSECDAIIMDNASVKAIPEITANHVEATLIHEAAIGKIAGEQIIKLMTLGLTEEEAERQIVNGFLK